MLVSERESLDGRCTFAIELRVNDIQRIRYPVDREILDVDGVEVVNQQYLAIGN